MNNNRVVWNSTTRSHLAQKKQNPTPRNVMTKLGHDAYLEGQKIAGTERNSLGHVTDSKTVLIIMLSIWLMVLHSFLGYSCGFTVQAQILTFSLMKPNNWGFIPNRSDR